MFDKNVFIFFVFFMCVMGAPSFAAQTCDPAYEGVLEARAWMAGKKDVELAQAIIHKNGYDGGHSVLEYSCFQTRIDELDGAAWSNDWPAMAKPIRKTDMAGKLDKLVGGAISGTLDQCDLMYKVWNSAKCSNFDKSSYLTIEEFIQSDPRSCGAEEPNRGSEWQDNYLVAYPDPARPGAYGGMHGLYTFLEVLYLKEGEPPQQCQEVQAIPTGVAVGVWEGGASLLADAVCPVFGCSYDGGFSIDNQGNISGDGYCR